MFVIKLQYGDDIRRVTVEKSLSVKELTDLAKSLFRDNLQEPYALKYKDDEGDLITIVSDRELEEAFRLFKDQGILRVLISSSFVPKKAPASTQTKAQQSQKNATSALDDLVDTLSPYFGVVEEGLKDVFPKIEEHWNEFYPKIEEQIKHVIPKVEETFAQVFPKEQPKREMVHGAICDACNTRIKGIRYKCVQCPDYDLCNSCKQQNFHKEHEFNVIFAGRPCSGPCRSASAPATPVTERDPRVLVPLRVATPEPKREEPRKPVDIPLQVVSKEEPKVEPKKEEPKEEPKKEELKKEEPKVSAFEAKLHQLEEMGFVTKERNVELLVKHKGDMIAVVKDLLE
jgi:hypothetical protein